MKAGLDTNVLIFAHMPSLPDHGRVRRFLVDQLASPDVTLAVTAGILHELVHIITDPRRFDPPVSMSEAIELAKLYLSRANVECLAIDETSMALALEWMDRHRLGRKRIADTLLAATLVTHGFDTLITCNPQDFTVFDRLTIVNPREA